MPLYFTCNCGKQLNAPDSSAGRRARCPACGAINEIPSRLAPSTDSLSQPASAAPLRINPALAYGHSLEIPLAQTELPVWRKYLYWVLLLAMIPLVLITFNDNGKQDLRLRAISTLHKFGGQNEEVGKLAQAMEKDDSDELTELGVLVARDLSPDNKLEGALLSENSHSHWLIALISAAFFFTLMLLIFPATGTRPTSLIFAGIFTGTVGILLLLGFQWCSRNTIGMNIWPGRAGIIFLILKIIGWSYYLSDHPEFGFFLSFLGFTVGVGLCEEITKFIPLLMRVKQLPGKTDVTWQGLVLWGLASGVGFGVAEGIMYAGTQYNGIFGVDIYAVRFASCVVLHSVWTASSAVTLFKRQHYFQNSDSVNSFFNIVICIAIPMTLHGLYDVLLAQEHPQFALLVALASFAYLAFQIERARRSTVASASC